jgi:hypothetical protein
VSCSIDTYQEDPASPNQNQNANADGNADADDVEMEAVNSSIPTTGEKEYEVLVRCTNGSDLNFSTRVSGVWR